jgi:spore coat polysaccharide biosynthesis protein SpsF
VLGYYRAWRTADAPVYASNVFPCRTWPKGYDTEVFGRALLVAAGAEATADYDREHVTPWMRRNAVTTTVVNAAGDQSALNYSVDTLEDLARVRRYADELAVRERR